MESHIEHVQINVTNKAQSFPFYKEFLTILEYKVVMEDDQVLGMASKNDSIWIQQIEEKYKEGTPFHRKRTGINHIALWVSNKDDVDAVTEKFVKPRKLTQLYETPKEFPEYTTGYYAVFFEDPDRIKIEVVYHPA